MTFHLITLFPDSFRSYLGESILKRAIEGIKPRRPKGSGSRPEASGKIAVKFYNPRDFVYPKQSREGYPKRSRRTSLRIDRAPYGGGPGMVIQAEPVIKAVEAALKESRIDNRESRKKLQTKNYKLKTKLVWLSPSGKQFDTKYAKSTAKKFTDIIFICGRYEGIDARVKQAVKTSFGIKMEEISVGPFVLTGGELPAMVMIDSIARQIPGVLGDINSLEENRVASPDVYTRPEVFKYKGKNYRVPKVLLSGHHKKIEEWKKGRTNH